LCDVVDRQRNPRSELLGHRGATDPTQGANRAAVRGTGCRYSIGSWTSPK
jgi:hypothetical protein